jgi:hypothetical protein
MKSFKMFSYNRMARTACTTPARRTRRLSRLKNSGEQYIYHSPGNDMDSYSHPIYHSRFPIFSY